MKVRKITDCNPDPNKPGCSYNKTCGKVVTGALEFEIKPHKRPWVTRCMNLCSGHRKLFMRKHQMVRNTEPV